MIAEEKNEKPIRILHYIKHLESGGGESLIFNIYKHIDREEIQFDFLVNTEKKELLTDRIEEMGGKVIPLMLHEPEFIPYKIYRVRKKLKKILDGGGYDFFHIHCSNGQGLLYANVAKRAGVPYRITHIHNSNVEGHFRFIKIVYHKLCRIMYMSAPTRYIACSNMAAKWLYSDKVIASEQFLLLRNGIECIKYRYNEDIRKQIRLELKLMDCVTLIHIGRLENEKNHLFLLDIFSVICGVSDKYRMILIGKGSMESIIKKRAYDLGIFDRIIFIDYTAEVEKYLWASDLFLLPSLSEGLGIVAVEAQAAGLPTIVSDRVPKEVFLTNHIQAVSINDSADEWADIILNVAINSNRVDSFKDIIKSGYDISGSAKILHDFYLSMCENR